MRRAISVVLMLLLVCPPVTAETKMEMEELTELWTYVNYICNCYAHQDEKSPEEIYNAYGLLKITGSSYPGPSYSPANRKLDVVFSPDDSGQAVKTISVLSNANDPDFASFEHFLQIYNTVLGFLSPYLLEANVSEKGSNFKDNFQEAYIYASVASSKHFSSPAIAYTDTIQVLMDRNDGSFAVTIELPEPMTKEALLASLPVQLLISWWGEQQSP